MLVCTIVISAWAAMPTTIEPANVDMDQRCKELQESYFGMFIYKSV